jgi:hypothetical protein
LSGEASGGGSEPLRPTVIPDFASNYDRRFPNSQPPQAGANFATWAEQELADRDFHKFLDHEKRRKDLSFLSTTPPTCWTVGKELLGREGNFIIMP